MDQVPPPHQPPPLDQLRFQFQRVAPLGRDARGWHEALVRWYLPDGTVRGPIDVLPFWLSPPHQAEFTRFTIECAAEALRAHPDACVSINLSPRQVSHPVAVATLEALRRDVRARLVVELTEQRLRDMGALWASVSALRERCGLVVIDDVTRHDMTTRFSVPLPVDGIKLDRGAVAMLSDPLEHERTVRFIQRTTERFEVVVAEGIEDDRLTDTLHDLGVTHLQGFAIGRPSPRLDVDDDGREGLGSAEREPPTGLYPAGGSC
jgi:EAL domain-containing protein (putative c-di-GMP-specific phosphodiesterase class I)